MAMAIIIGLVCGACQSVDASGVNPRTPLGQLVAVKAQQHNVPVPLAHAIVSKESGYNPRVISKGNYGLGQIRCGTARGLGFSGSCRDLLDPNTNLTYSMRYLREALDKSRGDWCKAATLYNRGINATPRRSAYCDQIIRLTRSHTVLQ